jgi:UrcA family protein
MIKTITAALLSAAIFATPLVASAQEGGRTTGVTYRDLDLATQEGRTELDRRIDAAAREACGMDETILGTRLPTSSQRRCYRDAREQLDQRFAQLVNANSGRS